MPRTKEQVEAKLKDMETDYGWKILKVSEWRTPCTNYPLLSWGSYGKKPLVQIKRVRYNRGNLFPMEGVDDYDYWCNTVPIKITMLYIDGKCWMTDECINWIGMQRLAELSSGKVLVAGLGLGMLCHALAKNDRVTSVDVLEVNSNVIRLIQPLVNYPKIKVTQCDFWKSQIFTNTENLDYQTIILDIWVWDQTDGKNKAKALAFKNELIKAVAACKSAVPEALVYVWGLCDHLYNPAVTKEKTKKLN